MQSIIEQFEQYTLEILKRVQFCQSKSKEANVQKDVRSKELWESEAKGLIWSYEKTKQIISNIIPALKKDKPTEVSP
jgi:hypothetical protein